MARIESATERELLELNYREMVDIRLEVERQTEMLEQILKVLRERG